MKLFFLTILTAISCLAKAQQGQVYGLVTDENKAPLEAATVSIIKEKDTVAYKITQSDKSGNFAFEAVPFGLYHVLVTAIGHESFEGQSFTIGGKPLHLPAITLKKAEKELAAVAVIARKPFIEQKADRMIVNVDASPANAGSTAMDVLEKSPGVTVDKDGNISLKGKQGVTVMIDDKPTYMTSAQLANYLRGLPASAIDQLEIMTNPSAKYDAAGNSGIINIKTKKSKARGFNGSITLTQTQSKYAKPGASLNLNYRNGKTNVFFNGGFNRWKGWHDLDINRNYLNPGDKQINSIFTQHTHMEYTSPSFNFKTGMDYFINDKTTLGFVVSGYSSNEKNTSESYITLKDAHNVPDSLVNSYGNVDGLWRNISTNINFRRKFDSAGTEITADADYVRYTGKSDQHYLNQTFDPDMNLLDQTVLTGNLPSVINIYSFKTDFTRPFKNDLKLEAGLKTSFVATDNHANYFNVENEISIPDTGKTNYFVYHENINAGYINLNKKYKKWNFQLGLRVENTNYSGHQFGNPYTVVSNDSSFSKSYINAFPTAFISYQLNEKNQFTANFGRRIDRPDYGDLNPFLFFLDQYTYQAGNPYLQPQYTTNFELAHTYHNFLTTTLNYSNTKNFFSETFEQQDHATIVRNGNIGRRENAGASVSLNLPLTRWWTTIVYANVNYNHFSGELYGEPIDASATTFMGNLNNQLSFGKGWSGELSGWYRSAGLEGQVLLRPMGQVSAAVSKKILKEKGNVKLGIRDIFYTQQAKGTINFQETQASFYNTRDSRQVSLTFTYRFGKPIQGPQNNRHSGGASEEANRVKAGGNN
ncbi:MAG TPA: TonB-dependent receptor [Puia sp.]|nr:TonB-dependent receptor [Puia sp.]